MALYKKIFVMMLLIASFVALVTYMGGPRVMTFDMLNNMSSHMFQIYPPAVGISVYRLPKNITPFDQHSSILSHLLTGHWKTRPLTKREAEDILNFLSDVNVRYTLPKNYQRIDGLCGNVTHTGSKTAEWIRALCDPKGTTPCCFNNKCAMKSVEECVCPDCYDMRHQKHAEYSTWTPSEPRHGYKEHSPQEACSILSGSTILFVGDSLVRHVYTAMVLLVTGNMKDGAMNENVPQSPLRWHLISTCCGGAKQSPVPLSTRGAACGQPYTLTYSQSKDASVSSVTYNNGQTATMTFPKGRLSLSDVPHRQGCTFLLGEIHYHAGITGDTGSEHWLEHTGYGAEVHLVHYNRKYSGIVEATSKPDGLVVIAILIQEARTSPNRELRRYVCLVSRLKANDTKLRTTIRPLLLLPRSKEFFIYEGSLTSPPCSESVLWVVMRQPLQLSSRRMQKLRNLPRKGGQVLATYTNVRPEQELNNRLVETNFPCSDNLDAFNTPTEHGGHFWI